VLRHGSQARRWVALIVRAASTVADIGFLVVGTGFVSIGVAIILNGLGLIHLTLVNDLAQSLGVGLVVTMIGGLSVGIAVEGPMGYSAPASTTKPWEALLATVPAMFLFVWLLGVFEEIADRFLLPYSELFVWVSAHLNAVGRAALTTGLLVGVPMMWAMRQFLAPRMSLLIGASPGVLYITWMIGVVALY